MKDDKQLNETGRLAEVGLQAATLVHEIRQPLFAVKAMAQVLAERSDSADLPELAELIAQVEVLEGLIGRYGAATQRPSGATSPTNLSAAVSAGIQVVHGHRPSIRTAWIAPQAPSWAPVDPVAVQQITSNLVRNAVDAARSEVVVELEGSRLTVRDDGPGILPHIEARLGEPFVTSKPPGEGTGLGLTVTRSLIEVIGGRLSWTTGPQGTCFEVELHNGRQQD